MKHWQRDATQSRLAAWAGVDRTFSVSFRVTITRHSATISFALGPFYCGAGVP